MNDYQWHTGFVIHKEDYGETSLRCLILTLDKGLIHVYAKGAKRKNSPLAPVLQYYSMLRFSLGGKQQNYINKVEVESIALRFKGINIYCAYYLNELVRYLIQVGMHSREESQELFNLYKNALLELYQAQSNNHVQLSLRKFEVGLIKHLGLLYDFSQDLEGEAIVADKDYYLIVEQGFIATDNLNLADPRSVNILAYKDPDDNPYAYTKIDKEALARYQAAMHRDDESFSPLRQNFYNKSYGKIYEYSHYKQQQLALTSASSGVTKPSQVAEGQALVDLERSLPYQAAKNNFPPYQGNLFAEDFDPDQYDPVALQYQEYLQQQLEDYSKHAFKGTDLLVMHQLYFNQQEEEISFRAEEALTLIKEQEGLDIKAKEEIVLPPHFEHLPLEPEDEELEAIRAELDEESYLDYITLVRQRQIQQQLLKFINLSSLNISKAEEVFIANFPNYTYYANLENPLDFLQQSRRLTKIYLDLLLGSKVLHSRKQILEYNKMLKLLAQKKAAKKHP